MRLNAFFQLISVVAIVLLSACGDSSSAADSVPTPAAAIDAPDFTVVLDNNDTLHSSTYTIEFTTGPSGGLSGGDTITVIAPIGTDFTDSSSGWTAVSNGAGVLIANVEVESTEPEQALNRFVVTLGSEIAAESEVTMTVNWVINTGPGDHYRLELTTSAEPEPRFSSAYAINGVGKVEWVTYRDTSVAPYQCLGQATGTTDCQLRGYMVYDPAEEYSPGRPLLVDLHGCFNSASNEARWSQFPKLAAERNFVVLFPQQSLLANGGRCWNWFSPDHQHRDAGEPALIAGMIREVANRYGTDPDRTYITGISGGGVMSSIMMVAYSDLFAAGAVLAGCQYQGLPCFGVPSIQPPAVAAQMAIDEMGGNLSSVPLFSVTGDRDEVVPALNAEFLVQQWLAIYGFRQTGEVSQAPQLPTETSREIPEGRLEYTHDRWRNEFGCLIAQRWTVHQMGHQWAGSPDNGSPQDQLVANPTGPELNVALVDFFLERNLPTLR